MSGFLDQSEIDRIQQELAGLSHKKDLAESAKDKIRNMYYDTIGYPINSAFDSLEEIGRCVTDVGLSIQSNSKYFQSFNILKSSYLKRI